ncbi:hypothetical protein [Anaerotignum sp.]
MKIKYIDSNDVYSSVLFIKEINAFQISGNHQNKLEYTPTLKLDSEYKPEDFYYYLLSNESPLCTENSIYQVYVGGQRIGWVFPLQALVSEEHDCVNNQYFLKYAYVATYLLLQDIDDVDKRNIGTQLLLEDYYDIKKNILIIDKNNVEKIESFSFENYLVGLFRYGYAFKGKGNVFSDHLPLGANNRITLKSLSTDLTMIPNINYLFEEQLSTADNEIIRFYLCYQIIELLITLVFEDQFKNLLTKISQDSEALFDERDNLSKIVGEKHRIKILFSNYVSCETEHQTDLDIACQKMLSLNGKTLSDRYYENLYSVRCLLVHRLYSLSSDSYDILKEINKPFLDIIMDILFTFKRQG